MSISTELLVLEHLAYSVFLPPKLPQVEQEKSFQLSVDLAIIRSVIQAGQDYSANSGTNFQWDRVELMLQQLYKYAETPFQRAQICDGIKNMRLDDSLALFIRAQNTGLMIRKHADYTTYEVFEVQAQIEDVMSVPGKICREFPGPAVRVPSSVANDSDFIEEVARILADMNVKTLDQARPRAKQGAQNNGEAYDSINPNYFIQYFLGFLRGVGTIVDSSRIVKRLADEVLWMNAGKPWRRSPLWLITRVALQTSLDSTKAYKHFMVYHHASVLSHCRKHDGFSSDLLYAMRVKLARRLYKIHETAPRSLVDTVKEEAERTQDLLQERWDKVQSIRAQCATQDFSNCDFESAINQTLPNSRSYLEQVFEGRSCHNNPAGFTPVHSPRLDNIVEFTQYSNGALSRAFSNDPHLALYDFEASVFDNISFWTSRRRGSLGACTTIASCFQQYLAAAQSSYKVDIADQSIMMLTLMRLWMAIDELATSHCPLLLEFSPEIPNNILDRLLLRTEQHLEQACIIQQHIVGRRNKSYPFNPSIFSDDITSSSFAVKYFKSSPRHQQLKLDIEKNAQEHKDQKLQELQELNERHQGLGKEIQDMVHQYYDTADQANETNQTGDSDEIHQPKQHSKFCERCAKEQERRGIKIQLCEWPLPPDQHDAEAVVFELHRPESFTVWRDITYEILVDLGGSKSSRERSNQSATLENYSALALWRSTPAALTPRVVMASSTGSFNELRHKTAVEIPALVDQVCTDNPLHFKLYDKNKGAWASEPFLDVTFAKYGTTKLPENSAYSHLEHAIQWTTHTSNEILASQYDCPKELSLHEHIAYGTLRSGAYLQWMNIVRGLEENLLAFSSDEVRLLHTQAAWQIGPLSAAGSREWHADLGHCEFGRLLVFQCTRVLDRVKANWLQANSVLITVTLVSRLLASSPPEQVVHVACDFLREARIVAHQWLRQLEVKLQASTQEEIDGYQARVCEVAALCRAAYDVEHHHMGLLLSTPDDYTALIESFTALYDNQPPDLQNAPPGLQVLFQRDRRFAHKMAPYLLTSINSQGGDILSDPLHKIWPSCQQELIGWWALEASNTNRWVTTIIPGAKIDRTQQVHWNLLTGQLLVDGQPLGRLPAKYAEHATYIRLFGQKVLEVIPAKSPGVEFTTRGLIHNYQVSFAFEGSKNHLIIQAQKGDRRYELIPHKMLSADFPAFFSEDYHHWADIDSKVIEFRPISSPWSANECRWLLYFTNSQYTLTNPLDGSSLLDIHSIAFESLSRLISPLESSRFLHVTRSHSGLIELTLPRMKLAFFVNEDMQLESQNFRGQIIDENQSAETLFGLENQLLLRTKGVITWSLPRSRAILVPDGKANFKTQGHHVSVSIRLNPGRDVNVYRYNIDTDLKCLVTNAGLTSRLFKIYLHGLTSHCLPDPLTGRTGTEEALYELSRASISSFAQIDRKQAKLLKAIGQLTPARDHPNNLQSIQATRWAEIPALSQHFAFSLAANAVLLRAVKLQLFQPLDYELNKYIAALNSSSILTKRATQRTAVYYAPGTTDYISQIICPEEILDKVCPGRDRLTGDWEEAGHAASWATSLTHQAWEQPLFNSFDLVAFAESFKTLDDPEEHGDLSYSSFWFDIKLKSCWINFYNLLRRVKSSGNKYMLSACLAGIAFGRTLPMGLIPVFLAFAINTEFQNLNPPSQRRFQFKDGYEPTQERVEEYVTQASHSIGSSPAGDLVQNKDEPYRDFICRRDSYYRTNLSKFQSHLVEIFMNQWPCADHQTPIQLHGTTSDISKWLKVDSCLASVNAYFLSCLANITMKDHLRELEVVLASHPTSGGIDFVRVEHAHTPTLATCRVYTSPWNAFKPTTMMHSRPAPELPSAFLLANLSVSRRTGRATDTSRLANLFTEFQRGSSVLNRLYGADLDKSRKELEGKRNLTLPQQLPPTTKTVLSQTREQCLDYLTDSFQQLSSTLSPQNEVEHIISLTGVWPRITPRILIELLSIKNRTHLEFEWQNELIGYAQGFVDYQRSQRLIILAESGDTEEFHKELDLGTGRDNPGMDDPDWLLVQVRFTLIDGNFGVRSLQRQVAQEMISPTSGSNTVLQLNMGEGKSSVIVPIIALSLADSSRLVRVMVLKPLWRQMFELLVNRLSGLANRRIYYLPFGRHIHVDNSRLQELRGLYEECMREGGILLAQPEHILSFKLMGIDRLISSRLSSSDTTDAEALLKTQIWLKTHTRDILDESDEILHVRYRLVYTVGEQQSVDDYPDRWTTTQQLLRLAVTHMKNLHLKHPHGVSYQPRDSGQFPILRIMPNCETEIEKDLISAIATDVLNGKLLNLSCDRLSPAIRRSLLDFFTENGLQYPQYESVRRSCSPTIWKGLLLVRGLLASGILIFVLKHKHYRIDYGLDLSRSLLAVPYRAKDIPSMRAEFGHPDISVALTCLSYYYHGLTEQHLDLCFKLIFKLDNPSLEYEQWVKQNSSTPDDLKQLNAVNTKDRQQFIGRLVPTFSYNPATIDFFLSSVVFPSEAKEFPEKLATSGWDLAEKKCHVTTGFSGTNDNRYLLPTSISQADPVKQLSTNALVMTHLIQPENNYYVCMCNNNREPLSTEEFLQRLVTQTPEIRVLLDVGAQMVEMQNEELVRCWLRLKPDIAAAIYFNNQDELVVLPQNGTPALLNTSPFAQRLDKCLVYLDDGHTRGTDLKLPKETRALVTLGPKVTKDRLLQGCMRMRKLGNGQSVVFAAPPEVDNQVRSAAPKPIDPEASIDALDVLRWAMLKTCDDLQRHVSQWAQQGIEFGQRIQAESRYERDFDIAILQKGWSTRESRTLEEMYGVISPEKMDTTTNITRSAANIPELRERLEDLGIKQLEDPGMDEEQEREVDHEVERERHTQRPPKETPAKHSIHSDVNYFVRTGIIPTSPAGIVPLFHPIRSSNAQMAASCSDLLFASCDFLQTIAESPIDKLSDYMRPVNWVVSGAEHVRVVLSPYEVNKLLPLLRISSEVRLHIYAPRTSLSMLPFSNLQFYSIPTSPINQMSSTMLSTSQLQFDLFAGQLYLSNYQNYASLCATLGLFVPPDNENDGAVEAVEIESDGFMKPEQRAQLVHLRPEYSNCRFTNTPIPALKDLIERRRKGMKYLLTHVGQIVHSRSLTPEDF
ncbi:NADH-ubiquinone oxidoreductase chain 5 [Rhizoctonia solani]|uniref:ubiquitinyl hydrolase 1 n=1 Tax=Rhizoctonia solani TaxID=456999 RepID=A0A0K6FQM5_9AGAM|nr:NADH-ubiquinone oxidoreductase chain 5 [Rhizoctonia solani]